MMTKLFVSQDCISLLETSGQIRLGGNILTILPEENAFRLVPAYRFLRPVHGDDDWKVAGKVLTTAEIVRLDGEIGEGCVDLGQSRYESQAGFVGDAMAANEVPGMAADSDSRLTDNVLSSALFAEWEREVSERSDTEGEPMDLRAEPAQPATQTVPPPALAARPAPPEPSLPMAPPEPSPSESPAEPSAGEDELSDEELLARYLLGQS